MRLEKRGRKRTATNYIEVFDFFLVWLNIQKKKKKETNFVFWVHASAQGFCASYKLFLLPFPFVAFLLLELGHATSWTTSMTSYHWIKLSPVRVYRPLPIISRSVFTYSFHFLSLFNLGIPVLHSAIRGTAIKVA